jgi:hypothetical protein
MLEYGEYKALVDILDKSELDDTYKDLMKKEDRVLDTVNSVVNHYKEKRSDKKQFVNMSLYEIYNLLFLEVPLMMIEMYKVETFEDFIVLFTKNNRLVYIGIILVILSTFLFFIENSK